jgi:threonylcarbamoyladenosine tRNA methylthiotransferase MtaB
VSGVEVITFGCRLNTYESEVMRAEAEKAGLNNAILVNTCAVTGEAVRQARQAIRRARRDNPHARIIVTGCAAQTEKETFAGMAEVDAVLGNEEKLKSANYRALPDFGVSAEEKLRVNDIMSVGHRAADGQAHRRARARLHPGAERLRPSLHLLHHPYGRGNSRSVPMGAVVDQARRLVESGYREIVLTGVDATSYGADLPGEPTLGLLAKTLLKQIPDIRRLRLSSIDSIEADRHLLDLIADERDSCRICTCRCSMATT